MKTVHSLRITQTAWDRLKHLAEGSNLPMGDYIEGLLPGRPTGLFRRRFSYQGR